MQQLIYTINFTSFWHTGSGLSGGVGANALVIKDDQYLPFIPGRTLKGMLRDAAQSLHELDKQLITSKFIAEVFGIADQDREEQDAYDISGIFFGNATLSAHLQQNISQEHVPLLYTTLASTAIDKNGQAKDHSLRQLEVTIPLKLYAAIYHFPDDASYKTQLETCFRWIKRMGYNRNRGLGRCTFQFENTTV